VASKRRAELGRPRRVHHGRERGLRAFPRSDRAQDAARGAQRPRSPDRARGLGHLDRARCSPRPSVPCGWSGYRARSVRSRSGAGGSSRARSRSRAPELAIPSTIVTSWPNFRCRSRRPRRTRWRSSRSSRSSRAPRAAPSRRADRRVDGRRRCADPAGILVEPGGRGAHVALRSLEDPRLSFPPARGARGNAGQERQGLDRGPRWPERSRVMPAAHDRAQGERRPVEFTAAPGSRLWIAICLGLGGAIFFACLMLGLGEVLFSLKRQVLEAILESARA
jgi:hypothetical protein